MMDLCDPRGALFGVVKGLRADACSSAGVFHGLIEQRLKIQGYQVRREVEIFYFEDNGDECRGRIDLVIDGIPPLAVELDWTRPREKSVLKLLAFDGSRTIVLRNARVIPTLKAQATIEVTRELGIEVIEVLHEQGRVESHRTPRGVCQLAKGRMGGEKRRRNG